MTLIGAAKITPAIPKKLLTAKMLNKIIAGGTAMSRRWMIGSSTFPSIC